MITLMMVFYAFMAALFLYMAYRVIRFFTKDSPHYTYTVDAFGNEVVQRHPEDTDNE